MSDGPRRPPDAARNDLPRDRVPCTTEELFDIFRVPLRRRALSCLYAADPPMRTDELAARCSSRKVDTKAPDHVTFALHHVHLPKLDEAGFLDYSSESRRVRHVADSAVEASVVELQETLAGLVDC